MQAAVVVILKQNKAKDEFTIAYVSERSEVRLTEPRFGICTHRQTIVPFSTPHSVLIRANGTSRLATADNDLFGCQKRESSPESVENGTIWVQSNHTVFHGDTMDEGLLVVEEVGVWNPQLVCYSVVQGQIERDANIC